MIGEITLNCGIENCENHYDYNHSSTNIVAISAQWRNKKLMNDWEGLLSESPRVGELYELLINFALKIDLAKNFWAIYFEPYTELEGIESEIGINSLRFCLCKTKDTIDIGKHTAKIIVEVQDVRKITDSNNVKTEINNRVNFIAKELHSSSVSVENYENFSLIKANYQSDCGWTYIIEKKNKTNRIIAENHWDFHKDIWMLTDEELNIPLK